MTELKTLKDIFQDGYMCSKANIEKELKAEAVKWIKFLGKAHKDYILSGEIGWIKHFFNITEEEIKGENKE